MLTASVVALWVIAYGLTLYHARRSGAKEVVIGAGYDTIITLVCAIAGDVLIAMQGGC